jgi:hypothetical protein
MQVISYHLGGIAEAALSRHYLQHQSIGERRSGNITATKMIMSGIERRTQFLEPFKPGECGKQRRSKRFIELRVALLAELGGDLGAIDSALVDQAVNLLVKAERVGVSIDQAIRATNTAGRILAQLRHKPKPTKDTTSLGSVLRAGIEQQRERERQ